MSASSQRQSIQLITVSPRPDSAEEADHENVFTFSIPNPANSETDADGHVVLSLEIPDTPARSKLDDPSVYDDLPTSPIDADVLQEVLDSRPSIQRGMRMSMRNRAKNGLSRTRSAYRPKTKEKQEGPTPRRLRRTSSLPKDLNSDAVTIEDIEDLRLSDNFLSVIQPSDLRRSTRRLKDRIEMHHQIERKPQVAKESLWGNFKHVKWPKIKSQLKVIRSWELWKGHMKEIEGHFGTSVVSYFVFLRWLFIMNVIIFAFWFGLVVVPNAIYDAAEDPPRSPSQLACVYNPTDFPVAMCSDEFFADANQTAMGIPPIIVYRLSGSNETSGVSYSCLTPEGATLHTIQICGFEVKTRNGSDFEVASEESSDTVTVSDMMIEASDCNYTDQSGNSIVPSPEEIQIESLQLCSDNISSFIPWYQFVIDFALGQGVFNETLLFYGRYGHVTFVTYRLPLAFFFLTIFVYAVSVLLIVYKMGQAYNESYIEVGPRRKVNFCNKLFTAWDFNITDPNTAKLKQVHIRTELEEELADFDKRNQKRTIKDLAIVFTIRVFTNLLTVLVLIGAGVAIFYSAQFSIDNQSSNGISLEGLLSPVVITTFNLVLPFLFSFLARFERFKTQSGEIKMTLVRTIFVRLSSLIVLIITLFILIQCTQDFSASSDDTTESESNEQVCTFSSSLLSELLISSNTNNTANVTMDDSTAGGESDESQSECPVCWETAIGQEFYKLGLTNFVISAASTISVETFRNIVSRFKYKGIGEKIGKGNFNIPKSILDLIYTQSLLWLGFIFSPMLPAVVLLTSFMLFYVKKYSLIYNLTPDKRGTYRAARTNFLFLLLLLVTLFIFLIPVGYTLSGLNPSSTCGPFQGLEFMFNVIGELVNEGSCATQQALDFLASAGFVVPVIILLLLVIYAQRVLLKTRKASFKLVKKQLILEGANVTHIVGKLDGVLQKVNEQRSLLSRQADQQQQGGGLKGRLSVDHSTGNLVTVPLKQRMEKARRESSVSYEQARLSSVPQHPALVEDPVEL